MLSEGGTMNVPNSGQCWPRFTLFVPSPSHTVGTRRKPQPRTSCASGSGRAGLSLTACPSEAPKAQPTWPFLRKHAARFSRAPTLLRLSCCLARTLLPAPKHHGEGEVLYPWSGCGSRGPQRTVQLRRRRFPTPKGNPFLRRCAVIS